MRIIISILFLTLSISMAAEPIIDIVKIAGKTKAEVEAVLGAPTKTIKTKYGEKCSYKKGETEIVFIKGLADWITVEAVDEVPFDKNAIKQLGLEQAEPVRSTDWEIRWENTQKLLSIQLFKGKEKSDYIYIKVKTK